MKKIIPILIMALAFTAPALAQSGLTDDEIEEIAEHVVMILGLRNGEVISQGSGILVSADGEIFTNRHVIEGADDYAILMLDDINEKPVLRYYAHAASIFEEIDFATLQIDRDADGNAILQRSLALPFLDFDNRTVSIGRGDQINVFGYPGNANGYLTFTQGIITTVQNGDIGSQRLPVWLQTDATISSGNSGGLAVNDNGELVGIPTLAHADARTGESLGGILPFNAIVTVIEHGTPVTPSQPDATPTAMPNPGLGSGESTTGGSGISIVCPDGYQITNGVEFTIVQMRPGYSYTATVLGVNGFDPVLAVTPTASSEAALCADDTQTAGSYQISLPSAPNVSADSYSAQITFSHDSSDLMDVSFIIEGYDGSAGEFIVLLEGMAYTEADVQGDPYVMWLTPNLTEAGEPLYVYMIGADSRLDPYMQLLDADLNTLVDTNGDPIMCDDAGTAGLCWGEMYDLSSSSVMTINQRVFPGDSNDAMLMLATDGMTVDDSYLMLMNSYDLASTGRYMLALHMTTTR